MSWSLAVRNGDLALGGARLGEVRGEAKLVQDLKHALLEHMGTDPYHLTYGSLIDGGRRADGTEVDSLIGTTDWDWISLQVRSDVSRIVGDHQNRQLDRAQNDRYRYNKATLSANETIHTLDNIDLIQAGDRLMVKIFITTLAGNPLTINLPVGLVPITT
jgi:hypothetical protein